MNLPRTIIKNETICPKCEEPIEVGEIGAIYKDKVYCELCVEDYEEEGRPI